MIFQSRGCLHMGYSLIYEKSESAIELSGSPCPRRVAQKVDGAPFYRIILSTKYWDWDTKLAYYGYRYYSPGLGRWLSRDPIGSVGGLNPFVFLRNVMTEIDFLGLYGEDVHYYLTYFLLEKCGLVDDTEFGTESQMIAWANQETDVHSATKPVFSPHSQNRRFHFRRVAGKKVKRDSAVARKVAEDAIEAEDSLLFGIGLHAFQDSFSHEGAEDMHSVGDRDNISADVEKGIEMAKKTYQLISFCCGKPFFSSALHLALT
jgi:RHS repeat-associated protein